MSSYRAVRIQIFAQVFIIILVLIPHTAWNAEKRMICAERYQELFRSFRSLSLSRFRPKVGIEIEGIAPKDVGLSGFAEVIRLKLADQYPNVSIFFDKKRNSYELSEDQYRVVYEKKDGRKLTWTIKEDRTVVTRETPLEITSPILETAEDFQDFRDVVQSVHSLGAHSHPESAGVHVHVDFSRAEGADLAVLAAVFSEVEKELKNRFSTHASRECYTENTERTLLRVIRSEDLDSKDYPLMNQLLDAQDRLHSLNLSAYVKQQTVEFRLFNSTFDLEALELMSDFALKLVKRVRTQDPKLVDYLTKNDNPIKLDELSKVIGTELHQPQAQEVLNRILSESQKMSQPHGDLNNPQQKLTHRLAVILTSVALVQALEQQVESLSHITAIDSTDK